MINRLVRRISTSLFPRPDRPWNDDATSNAPSIQIGTKRRFNDEDDEDDAGDLMPPPSTPGTPTTPGTPRKELGYGSIMKKQRVKIDTEGEEQQSTPPKADNGDVSSQEQGAVENGVKEVTEGVREVEIASQTAGNAEVELKDTVAESGKTEAIIEGGEETGSVTTEATAAAAVPLPSSPVLQAQSQSEEPEIVEVDANGVVKKQTQPMILELEEEKKAESTAQVKDVVDLTEDAPPTVAAQGT
ncbi:hypothetical protein BC835DRAFT_1380140 [Cytidiella melzeri]|nr:hypothetical protein BC835DRAFT_1380140 [Cytidiella melzeri]